MTLARTNLFAVNFADCSSSSSRNTRKNKGLVKYNPTHGITSMKKHLDVAHPREFGRYVTEAKAKAAAVEESRQKSKKRKTVQSSQIIDFFNSRQPYKKAEQLQINFITNLVLIIAKGCVQLSIVESQWLRHIVLQCDSKIAFPSRR
jgi:hypothetical protein